MESPVVEPDAENVVRTLLALAGVSPSEAETNAFVDAYPVMRADMERLYAVPDTPLADGILVFRPADGASGGG